MELRLVAVVVQAWIGAWDLGLRLFCSETCGPKSSDT